MQRTELLAAIDHRTRTHDFDQAALKLIQRGLITVKPEFHWRTSIQGYKQRVWAKVYRLTIEGWTGE